MTTATPKSNGVLIHIPNACGNWILKAAASMADATRLTLFVLFSLCIASLNVKADNTEDPGFACVQVVVNNSKDGGGFADKLNGWFNMPDGSVCKGGSWSTNVGDLTLYSKCGDTATAVCYGDTLYDTNDPGTSYPPPKSTIQIENNAGCKISTNGEICISDPQKSGSVKITEIYDCGDNHYTASETIAVELKGCNCDGGGGGGGGGGNVQNGCVDFRVFLGPNSPSDDAGFLWLYADAPSNNLATPAALQIPFIRNNVIVLTNAEGVIRQVKVPTALVNVTPATNYQYEIQVFPTNNVGLAAR